MSVKVKAPVTPPLLKNTAAAPFIYFDQCPVRGALFGNIEVELTARSLLPKSDGSVALEAVCVGHLRCSPQSAQALIEALQNALEIHAQTTAMVAQQEEQSSRLTN